MFQIIAPTASQPKTPPHFQQGARRFSAGKKRFGGHEG